MTWLAIQIACIAVYVAGFVSAAGGIKRAVAATGANVREAQ
jgi:hypothetical protein